MIASPQLGPIGRLGRWTATHFRVVAAAWLVAALGLGFLAPRVETALSGAGWEATGSESVQARKLIDASFDGLGTYAPVVVVHAKAANVDQTTLQGVLADVRGRLKRDPAVSTVTPPLLSPDGRTAVIRAGAARDA